MSAAPAMMSAPRSAEQTARLLLSTAYRHDTWETATARSALMQLGEAIPTLVWTLHPPTLYPSARSNTGLDTVSSAAGGDQDNIRIDAVNMILFDPRTRTFVGNSHQLDMEELSYAPPANTHSHTEDDHRVGAGGATTSTMALQASPDYVLVMELLQRRHVGDCAASSDHAAHVPQTRSTLPLSMLPPECSTAAAIPSLRLAEDMRVLYYATTPAIRDLLRAPALPNASGSQVDPSNTAAAATIENNVNAAGELSNVSQGPHEDTPLGTTRWVYTHELALHRGAAALLLLDEAVWPLESLPSFPACGSLACTVRLRNDVKLTARMRALVPPGVMVPWRFVAGCGEGATGGFDVVVRYLRVKLDHGEHEMWSDDNEEEEDNHRQTNNTNQPSNTNTGVNASNNQNNNNVSNNSDKRKRTVWSVVGIVHNGYRQLGDGTEVTLRRVVSDGERELRANHALHMDSLPVHAATSLVIALRRRTYYTIPPTSESTPNKSDAAAVDTTTTTTTIMDGDTNGGRANEVEDVQMSGVMGYCVVPLCQQLPMRDRHVRMENLPALRGPFSARDDRVRMINHSAPYRRLPVTLTLTLEYHETGVLADASEVQQPDSALSSPVHTGPMGDTMHGINKDSDDADVRRIQDAANSTETAHSSLTVPTRVSSPTATRGQGEDGMVSTPTHSRRRRTSDPRRPLSSSPHNSGRREGGDGEDGSNSDTDHSRGTSTYSSHVDGSYSASSTVRRASTHTHTRTRTPTRTRDDTNPMGEPSRRKRDDVDEDRVFALLGSIMSELRRLRETQDGLLRRDARARAGDARTSNDDADDNEKESRRRQHERGSAAWTRLEMTAAYDPTTVFVTRNDAQDSADSALNSTRDKEGLLRRMGVMNMNTTTMQSDRLASVSVVDLMPRTLTIAASARAAIRQGLQSIRHPLHNTQLFQGSDRVVWAHGGRPLYTGQTASSLALHDSRSSCRRRLLCGIRFEGISVDAARPALPADLCLSFSYGPLPMQQLGPVRAVSVERTRVYESYKLYDAHGRAGWVWAEPVNTLTRLAMSKFRAVSTGGNVYIAPTCDDHCSECHTNISNLDRNSCNCVMPRVDGESVIYIHLYDALTMFYIATAVLPCACLWGDGNDVSGAVSVEVLLQRDASMTESVVPEGVFPIMRGVGQLHATVFRVEVTEAEYRAAQPTMETASEEERETTSHVRASDAGHTSQAAPSTSLHGADTHAKSPSHNNDAGTGTDTINSAKDREASSTHTTRRRGVRHTRREHDRDWHEADLCALRPVMAPSSPTKGGSYIIAQRLSPQHRAAAATAPAPMPRSGEVADRQRDDGMRVGRAAAAMQAGIMPYAGSATMSTMHGQRAALVKQQLSQRVEPMPTPPLHDSTLLTSATLTNNNRNTTTTTNNNYNNNDDAVNDDVNNNSSNNRAGGVLLDSLKENKAPHTMVEQNKENRDLWEYTLRQAEYEREMHKSHYIARVLMQRITDTYHITLAAWRGECVTVLVRNPYLTDVTMHVTDGTLLSADTDKALRNQDGVRLMPGMRSIRAAPHACVPISVSLCMPMRRAQRPSSPARRHDDDDDDDKREGNGARTNAKANTDPSSALEHHVSDGTAAQPRASMHSDDVLYRCRALVQVHSGETAAVLRRVMLSIRVVAPLVSRRYEVIGPPGSRVTRRWMSRVFAGVALTVPTRQPGALLRRLAALCVTPSIGCHNNTNGIDRDNNNNNHKNDDDNNNSIKNDGNNDSSFHGHKSYYGDSECYARPVMDAVTQDTLLAWEEVVFTTTIPSRLGRQRLVYLTLYYDAAMTRAYETWELAIFAVETMNLDNHTAVAPALSWGQSATVMVPVAPAAEALYCSDETVSVREVAHAADTHTRTSDYTNTSVNNEKVYALRVKPAEPGIQRMLLHVLRRGILHKILLTLRAQRPTPSFTQLIELSSAEVERGGGPLFRRLTFIHRQPPRRRRDNDDAINTAGRASRAKGQEEGGEMQSFRVEHNYRYHLRITPMQFRLPPGGSQALSLQFDSLVLPPGHTEGRWPMWIFINTADTDETVESYLLQVVLRAHATLTS